MLKAEGVGSLPDEERPSSHPTPQPSRHVARLVDKKHSVGLQEKSFALKAEYSVCSLAANRGSEPSTDPAALHHSQNRRQRHAPTVPHGDGHRRVPTAAAPYRPRHPRRLAATPARSPQAELLPTVTAPRGLHAVCPLGTHRDPVAGGRLTPRGSRTCSEPKAARGEGLQPGLPPGSSEQVSLPTRSLPSGAAKLRLCPRSAAPRHGAARSRAPGERPGWRGAAERSIAAGHATDPGTNPALLLGASRRIPLLPQLRSDHSRPDPAPDRGPRTARPTCPAARLRRRLQHPPAGCSLPAGRARSRRRRRKRAGGGGRGDEGSARAAAVPSPCSLPAAPRASQGRIPHGPSTSRSRGTHGAEPPPGSAAAHRPRRVGVSGCQGWAHGEG